MSATSGAAPLSGGPWSVRQTNEAATARGRNESWMRIVGDIFGRHVTSEFGHTSNAFHGTLQHRRIGDFGVSLIETGPHAMSHAGAGGPWTRGQIHFNLFLAGTCDDFSQAGRTAKVRAGDFVVDDSDEPYSMSVERGFRCLCFHVPKSKLAPSFRAADRVGARRIPAELVEGQALRGLVEALTRSSHESLLPTLMLADAAAGVASAALLRVGGEDAQEGTGELHLQRAKSYIDARLEDESLSPDSIATGIHISVRYLHIVFASEGMTVGAYVKQRRVERAAALLADPRAAKLSAAEVGSRCGFKDPSHFSRVFAQQMGVTPARYRSRNDD